MSRSASAEISREPTPNARRSKKIAKFIGAPLAVAVVTGCASGPPWGDVPGGSLGCSPANSNAHAIYNYIIGHTDLKTSAVAAIIGNAQYESGDDCINPSALGDYYWKDGKKIPTSYGAWQWHDGRWIDLKEYTGEQNPDINAETKYLVHSLKVEYPQVYAQLEKDVTPGGASDDFAAGYEVCNPCNYSERRTDSDNIADYASAHGWTGAPPMPTPARS